MEWLWSRIDRGLGAIAVAAGAIVGSQITPFVAQYLARTGERVAEAQAQVLAIRTSLKYQVMSETVRGDLAAEASRDLAAGQAIHEPIAGAGFLVQPFALWRNADAGVFERTMAEFVPALPVSGDAIAYTILGLLAGFLTYELVRWPVIEVINGPPRRRFRRKT